MASTQIFRPLRSGFTKPFPIYFVGISAQWRLAASGAALLVAFLGSASSFLSTEQRQKPQEIVELRSPSRRAMRELVLALSFLRKRRAIIKPTLESLRFCDEVVIVDMHSTDADYVAVTERDIFVARRLHLREFNLAPTPRVAIDHSA
jgi:hypothetical protein